MTLRLASVAALAFIPTALACKKQDPPAETPFTVRETKLELEDCDVLSAALHLDADGDGRAEIHEQRQGERVVCRSVDLDLDGRPDRTSFFDEQGRLRRVQSDFDRDGRVDEIALYEAGSLIEKHRATSLDGKLDTWDFFQGGRLVRTERDEDGDGIVDQWWEYPAPGCPLIHVDVDADGRPDPDASVDYCKVAGETRPEPSGLSEPSSGEQAEPGPSPADGAAP